MRFFNVIVSFCVFFFAMSCGSVKKVRTSKNNKSNSTTTKIISKKTTNTEKTEEQLEATSKVVVTYASVTFYIDAFKEIAKSNMKEYGIPASITLAQGILESGAGNGTLSKKANNHFGIKCHLGWEGDKVYHDDDEKGECFRKYNEALESYRDHSLFLTSRTRYNFLFELDKGDYKSWANGLRQAGYATDVKYPSKLISLIERYKLYDYDSAVLGYSYIYKNEETKEIVQLEVVENEHKVVQGDTLYNISKRFNTTVDELIKLNKILNHTISVGQILKIK
jgi:flagellum-specific peptidoglycan hydrolase FlgJ